MENPWLYESWGMMVQPVAVDDRIQELKKFGIEKLKAVIAYDGTQATVRKRAEAMLRRLIREGGA